jgi:hypothetical protein
VEIDRIAPGAPVEIDRNVNATGTVPIAGKHDSVGQQFAGRRITLRLNARLQGARMPGISPATVVARG